MSDSNLHLSLSRLVPNMLRHKHRAISRLLYAPWNGPWVWNCTCACGYEWEEPNEHSR